MTRVASKARDMIPLFTRHAAPFAKRRDISDVRIRRSAVRLRTPAKCYNGTYEAVDRTCCLPVDDASPVSANLGANSEMIEDAYGTIVQRRLLDDGKVSVVYTKGRYLYMVTFANSRSILESYSRAQTAQIFQKRKSRSS